MYTYIYIHTHTHTSWWFSGNESVCQSRRDEFNPWVRKIPWRMEWQPATVFLPGTSHGKGAWWVTVHEVAESDMTKQQHAHYI